MQEGLLAGLLAPRQLVGVEVRRAGDAAPRNAAAPRRRARTSRHKLWPGHSPCKAHRGPAAHPAVPSPLCVLPAPCCICEVRPSYRAASSVGIAYFVRTISPLPIKDRHRTVARAIRATHFLGRRSQKIGSPGRAEARRVMTKGVEAERVRLSLKLAAATRGVLRCRPRDIPGPRIRTPPSRANKVWGSFGAQFDASEKRRSHLSKLSKTASRTKFQRPQRGHRLRFWSRRPPSNAARSSETPSRPPRICPPRLPAACGRRRGRRSASSRGSPSDIRKRRRPGSDDPLRPRGSASAP